MEELLIVIEKLTKNGNSDAKLVEQCYRNISECKFNSKNEENCLIEYVLPQLYVLYERNIVQKNIVYLSLIAGGNIDVLHTFISYDKNLFKLSIQDPVSLFDYTVYTKQHWFEKILFNLDECRSVFNSSILNKILVLKLIYLTNNKTINIQKIREIVNNIGTDGLDEFWCVYIWEVRRTVNLSEFCKKLNSNCDEIEIFLHSRNNCILDTLSNYLDFSKVNKNEIIDAIRDDEIFYKTGNVQSEIFASFALIVDIISILLPQSNKININEVIQTVKSNILSIENLELQIELLENIFALLFLKRHNFIRNIPEDLYICSEKHIRIILFLLKDVLDELKLKNTYNKETPAYKKFLELNKYVVDATWRLELVENIKSPEQCEKNLLKYMLASPESLIQMCLKRNDFERTYQVINLFELQNSPLSIEIDYTEKLNNLKETIRKISKIREIQKLNPHISTSNDAQLDQTINDFFKTNKIIVNQDDEDILQKMSEQDASLVHYKIRHDIFKNMLDLSLTQPKNYEDCEVMLKLAFENNSLESNVVSNYSIFVKKVLDVFREIGVNEKLAISEIVYDPRYELDLDRYKKEEQFYEDLKEVYDEFYKNFNIDEPGILNSNHPSHKVLIKLNKLCNDYVETKTNNIENTKYLIRTYNYLKSFSRIFYIEQNTSDIVSKGKNTSYFELLQRNRSELTGKLLFERRLDPSEFEKYFGKLKLDYLYHVVGNCFPTINLHTEEVLPQDELYPENNYLFTPSVSIITYIQKRNWLLAFILNEMFKIEGVKIDISRDRIKTFLNYMDLPKIKNLSSLFENNLIITALQNEISHQKVAKFINVQILKHDMTCSHMSHSSSSSFEAPEEIQEDAIQSTNWTTLFELMESIPEAQMKKRLEFKNLRDHILANLIQDGLEFECYKYVRYISDRDLRVNIILENVKKWPGEFCIKIIKAECTKFNFVHDVKILELKMWLQQIELCEQLRKITELEHWSKAYNLCISCPEIVITKLLDSEQVDLLIEYIDLHQTNEDLLTKINYHHFLTIFLSNISLETIHTLLEHLPIDHSLNICYNLLKCLKKLDHLQFVVDHILKNIVDDSLRNVEISLKMLKFFSVSEQEQLLCLIHEPLDIIEILVMNTKFDKLTLCLDVLRKEISAFEYDENGICIHKIDELLRKYAEKCLDFRVITQPNPRLLRTPECKLMQSLDSLNLDPKGFVMPENVPCKEDWVQNNEVLECMGCQKVVFSMFNRRHHCRRCGRVICYNCSMKRMLVPTYGDILVRVCNDCYSQTHGSSQGSEQTDQTSTKSIMYDYWLLTDDPDHNLIVREEFSYEHAPSVSLCLNIMKFHSKNEDYAKFLLTQCEIMLKLLQPSQEPLQEIDYLLVIKMLKSLVASLECTSQYGTSLADRVLLQAELLALLAERGCLSLLPVSGHSSENYIVASVLRRLRDKLLEREQWHLALEVSTKAGLDNSGSEQTDQTSTKSIMYDYWLLTDDPDHNLIVREEFSYEHAPSVSLCLNIMKFHSKNEDYAKFLLTQCEIMLKLLQPSQEPLQEIDYLLVIKMLKSLVASLECTSQYGTSLADRVLLQAELLALLAERGCLSLLPVSGHSSENYIVASVLRRLRDKLLEREQWHLALEVSTKAGLDNSGVFAAWGKSCLKAGSLLLAREKFQRCFDGKSHHYESFSDTLSEMDESLGVKKRLRNTSSVPESAKPAKNPPLLNDIVHILESKTHVISKEVMEKIEAKKMSSSTLNLNQGFGSSFTPDAAICVINKLKNLKGIASGNYDVENPVRMPYSSKPPADPIFYDECIYYLSRYGTHLSLITFYIKHGQMEKALNYVTINKLGTDIFIEIYMKCLKDGLVTLLQEHLSKIDCTLDMWKDYLTQICCHLEKHNMLNSLYQLQQYMGDYIRAAMTCIRFYEDNVNNFTDLLSNSNYLQKAEEHLRQVLEQEQWVEVASVKSSTTTNSFEEKGITNPSLVMKMSSKEIDRHILTLELQNEVTKFLSSCECLDTKPVQLLINMIPIEEMPQCKCQNKYKIPTLFGTALDKKNLAVLAIISGEKVEDGFDVCLKIIKVCKLKHIRIYNEAGKQLAKSERYDGIVQLVNCIKKSDTNDTVVKDMCDKMLTSAIATFTKANVSGTKVEDLIKLISDRATKISAYIEAKQLKTAYFLAVKYKRMSDIRRILRESELLNQPNIKTLCLKVLQSHSQAPSYSKEKDIKE